MDNKKEVKKLTELDFPELKTDNPSPDQMYCRFYKETWTGWEVIKCTDEYSSEEDCRRAVAWAGVDGFSWTGRSC